MLTVENLEVSYGQSRIIEGLRFEVGAGEIVAILGRNGMGKTTLMRSLSGMIASAGRIALNGVELAGLKSFERVRRGLALVPQGRMIFSAMTVKENIETGLTATGKKRIDPDICQRRARRGSEPGAFPVRPGGCGGRLAGRFVGGGYPGYRRLR